VDSPYERPDSPELRIDTTVTSPSKAADRVVELLRAMQILGR
jgi:bifunctional enzyme CysN/CysC